MVTIGTTLMVEAKGYILRISTKEWVDQVFKRHMEMSPAQTPLFFL